MKLIFLHGPPASGKYTIARILHDSYGVLNFHNHLTIDVAKSLFNFGTPEFWDLTHRLRRTALAARAERGAADVVFTNCYSSPHDDPIVEALERDVISRGGEFLPVFLECSVAELRRRVVAPSRKEMRKIHSVDGLDRYMGEWNFVALDRPSTLAVTTDARSPEECAEEIAQRVFASFDGERRE
jgi:adenylylsulfate kinase-like enzyme